MKCPKCSERAKVLASRPTPNEYLQRTRECSCGYRFKTVEIPLDDLAEKQKEGES